MNKTYTGMSTLAAILFGLLLASTAGLSFYIWQTNNVKSSEVEDLKKQLMELKDTSENTRNPIAPTTNTNDTSSNTKNPNSCDILNKLPVVIYTPGGLFNEAEKLELANKVVNPFFDFHNETSMEYVAMTIEKYNPVPAHGYKYNVNAININGGYQGFLFGQSNPLEWWLPECMGGCTLSPEFKTKYPEISANLE